MTDDPGIRERRPRPDFDLPRVVAVTSRLTTFEPPKHRNFESQVPRVEGTVEFLVETDGPIPIRALAPVLYVGETPAAAVGADDDTHYRFVVLEPSRLRDGEPVALGWMGAPPSERSDAGIRFTSPEGFTYET
jgi:hypothetical protein